MWQVLLTREDLRARPRYLNARNTLMALIDQGISALFANDRTSQKRKDLAEKIMTAVGHVVWLDAESKMDNLVDNKIITELVTPYVNFSDDPDCGLPL